jgi:glycosyltransferase involved in cell wall biosynthesis
MKTRTAECSEPGQSKRKVLLLTQYGTLGSSSRVRCYQYLDHLESMGWQFVIEPLFGNDYVQELYWDRISRWAVIRAYARRLGLLLGRERYDLIWLQREALPWFPAWVEKALLRGRAPVVIDLDDAWFHRYDLHRWRVVRWLLSDKVDRIVRQARLVVVGNDYLAERMRVAGARRVEQLPSVVDALKYRPKSSRDAPRSGVVIGWIGSPATAHHLAAIGSVLREIIQESGAHVVAVGARNDQLEGLPIEVHPWTEATEANEISRFDVGIMPLPDAPFERGKCGYKLIQYMAAGIPVVASRVGASASIVRDGIDGFLVSSPAEWTNALKTLSGDPGLRERMGASARRRAEEGFSVQCAAPRLEQLLSSAASPPGDGRTR